MLGRDQMLSDNNNTNTPSALNPSLSLSSTYTCAWDSCSSSFDSLKQLVLHANSHVSSLDWSEKTASDETLICKWTGCWNPLPFTLQERMIEHMRAHTLEKPYMCPVKSCRQTFTVRSNCMAHGRTRHNRTYKPIFIDINNDEHSIDVKTLEDEEEENYQDEYVEYKLPSKMTKRKNNIDAGKRMRRFNQDKPQELSLETKLQKEIRSIEDKKLQSKKLVQWSIEISKEIQASKVRFFSLAQFHKAPEHYLESYNSKMQMLVQMLHVLDDTILKLNNLYDENIIPGLRTILAQERDKNLFK